MIKVSKQKISIDNILLLVILLVAAILRFWNYSSIPYMHDELSALTRAHYSNFRDEITYGVAIYDTHPAGIQLFIYYWTKLFGTSEMSVKPPFILFGLSSIIVAYKISKVWFNSSVGLIVAAFMATIQYMVMYSQIARPYIAGMFFCLLMVWCWSNYLFGSGENKKRWLAGYLFSSALCAYSHHFALLFAVIVGLTGLFFIDKSTLKAYLLAGAAIFILYIPHLNILFYQLNKGGLGGPDGWLGKPDSDWLYKYLKYTLHFSYWMYSLFALLLLLSIFFYSKEIKTKQRFRFLAIGWFLVVFLIEYIYSLKVNPVIQYSTLIFVFPFFLIFIFSLFGELSGWAKMLIVLSILVVGCGTLVLERKHFQVFYKQPYEEQVKNAYKNLDKIKDEKKATIELMIPDYYKEYYFKKYNRSFECVYFNPFDEKANTKKFRTFVQNQGTEFFIAGNLPLDYIKIIEEKYPYIIDKEEGFTYSTYCFGAKKQNESRAEKVWFSKKFDLTNMGNKMNSTTEYGPAQTIKLKEVIFDRHSILNISARIFVPDPGSNPTLVADIEENGKSILWSGSEYFNNNNNLKSANTVFLCKDLTDFDFKKHPDAQIKIYIWNRDKKDVFIEDFKIEIAEGNHLIYALYEPIN